MLHKACKYGKHNLLQTTIRADLLQEKSKHPNRLSKVHASKNNSRLMCHVGTLHLPSMGWHRIYTWMCTRGTGYIDKKMGRDLGPGLPAHQEALPEPPTSIWVRLHHLFAVIRLVMAQDACHIPVPCLTRCRCLAVLIRVEHLQHNMPGLETVSASVLRNIKSTVYSALLSWGFIVGLNRQCMMRKHCRHVACHIYSRCTLLLQVMSFLQCK